MTEELFPFYFLIDHGRDGERVLLYVMHESRTRIIHSGTVVGYRCPEFNLQKSKRSFDHSPSRCQWLFVWSRTSDVTQLYFIHLGLRAEEGIVYWNLLQLLQGPLFAVKKNCAI